MSNGIELPFLYAAVALGLAFTGAGAFSLDSVFGLAFLGETSLVEGVLVLAVLGAAAMLGLRPQDQKRAPAA